MLRLLQLKHFLSVSYTLASYASQKFRRIVPVLCSQGEGGVTAFSRLAIWHKYDNLFFISLDTPRLTCMDINQYITVVSNTGRY